MQTQECIKTRRSIRKFLPVPVEFEKLGRILDAGRLAPSAGNVQNWKFIVVTDDAKKRAVVDACVEQFWIETAPVLVVVCGDPVKVERLYGDKGAFYTIQNCAAAIENMLLTAHDMSIGSCWVGAFDDVKLRAALAIPDNVVPQAVLPIGYAEEKPIEPSHLTIENVVYLERYGNRVRDIASFMDEYSVHVQKAVAKLKGFVARAIERIKK
ncbi:MAG: nitroreductase family protein [Candidatus Aenigmarchaeota archaeon]|nr:nitroreductase family protein [Candidatus Aenigmarchaeota archaeon]